MSYRDMRENKVYPYLHAFKKGWAKGFVSLQVGTTHHCVNRCAMCQHWARPNAGYRLNLDLEKFTSNVLNPFYQMGGESICYSGGESMNHPEMDEIVRRTLGLGIKVGIITSGAGAAFSGSLVPYNGCDWFRISLDAVDEEVYEKSRGPGFKDVMGNIKRIANETDGVKMGFGITLHKYNYKTLPNIFRFIADNTPKDRLESIRVWPVRGEGRLAVSDEELYQTIHLSIPELLPLSPFSNNFHDILDRLDTKSDELPKDAADLRCVVPVIHLYIDASLKVFPCCAHAGDAEVKPTADPIYDLSEQQLGVVWEDVVAKEKGGHDYSKGNEKACEGCMLRLYTINKTWSEMGPAVRHFI